MHQHLQRPSRVARVHIAGVLGWMLPDGTKMWEYPATERLPDKLTEEQAKACVDRLRAIWRDGYDADPMFGKGAANSG